ncbi:MAG: glycosyl hydrolase [Chloroflexota bacterium]
MPRIRSIIATMGIVAMLGLAPAAAASPDGGAADAAVGRAPLALGISDIDDSWSLDGLDAETAHLGGHVPAIWGIWRTWEDPALGDFPDRALLDGISDRGAVPMIYWQPDPLDRGLDLSFRSIARGDHDPYLVRWARAAAAYGRPVLVRFAFEMNGTWFPWSVGRPGNSPAEFVAAWRHVVGLVRAEGATDVRFIWNPAGGGPALARLPLASIYPGDAWVDYAGFDAYNRDTAAGWRSMVELYRPAMRAIRALTRRPVIVAETGSVPGARKAAWIRTGYPEVRRRWPGIVAIVYFDVDMRVRDPRTHHDWRLASPAGALRAYLGLLDDRRFSGRLANRGATTWLPSPR